MHANTPVAAYCPADRQCAVGRRARVACFNEAAAVAPVVVTAVIVVAVLAGSFDTVAADRRALVCRGRCAARAIVPALYSAQ